MSIYTNYLNIATSRGLITLEKDYDMLHFVKDRYSAALSAGKK